VRDEIGDGVATGRNRAESWLNQVLRKVSKAALFMLYLVSEMNFLKNFANLWMMNDPLSLSSHLTHSSL